MRDSTPVMMTSDERGTTSRLAGRPMGEKLPKKRMVSGMVTSQAARETDNNSLKPCHKDRRTSCQRRSGSSFKGS